MPGPPVCHTDDEVAVDGSSPTRTPKRDQSSLAGRIRIAAGRDGMLR